MEKKNNKIGESNCMLDDNKLDMVSGGMGTGRGARICPVCGAKMMLLSPSTPMDSTFLCPICGAKEKVLEPGWENHYA